MELAVINIGNSKGIRLSKTILEKYNISDKIKIFLEDGYILLKPIEEPRLGWEESFREMHENGEDQLLIDDVFDDENLDEWSV
jgi:antitoxin MazE